MTRQHKSLIKLNSNIISHYIQVPRSKKNATNYAKYQYLLKHKFLFHCFYLQRFFPHPVHWGRTPQYRMIEKK